MRNFGFLPLSYLWVTAASCGVQKETSITAEDTSKVKNTQSDFVVKGTKTDDAQASLGKCVVDLRQDVIIDPKASGVTALFSGKMDPSCVKNKKLVLYIFAPGEFKVGPEYMCVLNEGEFNVKCTGPSVELSGENFSISLNGGGQFNSSAIKMKLLAE